MYSLGNNVLPARFELIHYLNNHTFSNTNVLMVEWVEIQGVLQKNCFNFHETIRCHYLLVPVVVILMLTNMSTENAVTIGRTLPTFKFERTAFIFH